MRDAHWVPGLAALLAVAWDTQLSPVDVRNLTESQRRRDPVGAWFSISRAKTGRAALGTLSKRTDRLLAAYVGSLGADLAGPAHVFRNRTGQPYSKDTLGDDFRAVRTALFGEGELRQLADFRRTGSTEALAGQVDPYATVEQDGEQPLDIEPTCTRPMGLCSSPPCATPTLRVNVEEPS